MIARKICKLPIMLAILAATTVSTYASERFYVAFELTQDKQVINRGNDYVTKKPHTWSRGLKTSYLRLRCDYSDPGKLKKMYSTVDHFNGLGVTHQLVGDKIEVTVSRSVVQNRRSEIQDLPKNQCKDLAPIVTTVTETYSYPARAGVTDTLMFGENMNFRFVIQSMIKASPVK